MDYYMPVGFTSAIHNPWFDFANQEGTFTPRVDVVEKSNCFELQMALPGLEKEQIKIEVKDHVLTVSGERKQVVEEGSKFKTIETRYGSFTRSFKLGESIDSESVSAEFKNGILTISILKKEQNAASPNVVEIK